MTSDIEARLRELSQDMDDNGCPPNSTWDLAREAADELATLKAILSAANAMVRQKCALRTARNDALEGAAAIADRFHQPLVGQEIRALKDRP